MERIFIGVGSNVEPERNVRQALLLLARQVRLVALSSFYLTEPHGRPDQPPFVNGVAEIATSLEPLALKRGVLRLIEERLGRRRSDDKDAPRTIDLDLLLWGDRVTGGEELRLPDPLIASRPFLAIPLAELAPDLVLPGTHQTLRQVTATWTGHLPRPHPGQVMQLLQELTNELRREVLP
jgi:dihydroneopterin aldolase/2-amino-4-hydroxy-6-hydroxymethyldihydropteridine diphosphokinase